MLGIILYFRFDLSHRFNFSETFYQIAYYQYPRDTIINWLLKNEFTISEFNESRSTGRNGSHASEQHTA